jgi:hypothetical protein
MNKNSNHENEKRGNNNKKPNIDEVKNEGDKDIIFIDLEDDINSIEDIQPKISKRKGKRNRRSVGTEKEKSDKETVLTDKSTKLAKVHKSNTDFSIRSSNSNINLHDLTI